jgi:hypothetical protein
MKLELTKLYGVLHGVYKCKPYLIFNEVYFLHLFNI